MLARVSKSVWPHTISAVHVTLNTCGNRKRMPVCMPEPRPTDESTPSPTHQTTYSAEAASSAIWARCGPSTCCAQCQHSAAGSSP